MGAEAQCAEGEHVGWSAGLDAVICLLVAAAIKDTNEHAKHCHDGDDYLNTIGNQRISQREEINQHDEKQRYRKDSPSLTSLSLFDGLRTVWTHEHSRRSELVPLSVSSRRTPTGLCLPREPRLAPRT